jgi:hypothetical protein
VGWFPYFWNNYIATLKSVREEGPWEKVVLPIMFRHDLYRKEAFTFHHLEDAADTYG